MLKRLLVCLFLAFAALLPACAPEPTTKIIQQDRVAVPPEPGVLVVTATMVEKVVTLVPQKAQNATVEPPAEPAASPTGRVVDQKAQEAVTANLRGLLGIPNLDLALKSLDRSPNASNYLALVFGDPQGNSYYISQDTLQPIEFTLEHPLQPADGGSAKTPDKLRALAEQIAKAHSTRFEALKDRLTYSEGNKSGENSFFRWELPNSDVGGMPAILQIGLKQDGTLFSYLNSLDLLP